MTNDLAVGITTFKKPQALRGSLDSLHNFGRVGHIHVSDDNNFEVQDLVAEYQRKHELGEYFAPLAYSSGPNVGIAKAKNRGLKWFLSEADASLKYWVMVDDDIEYTRDNTPGGIPCIGDALVTASARAGIRHVTGYLGGSFGQMLPDGTVNFSADPFFTQFPPRAEDSLLYYTWGGTQGVLLFFHRELVELLGYFDTDWKGRYGYEHAHFSMRANRIEGRAPELYPILKNSPAYFHCQGIANNYEAHPEENVAQFVKKQKAVYDGIMLSNRNAGV